MISDKPQFVHIEITGKSKELWRSLRPKLIEELFRFSFRTAPGDPDCIGTVEQFTDALENYGETRLKNTRLEDEKTIAEVDLIYSQRQRELAMARKANAEAENLQMKNHIAKWTLRLQIVKLVMISEGDQADLVFIKEIDSFLEKLKTIL